MADAGDSGDAPRQDKTEAAAEEADSRVHLDDAAHAQRLRRHLSALDPTSDNMLESEPGDAGQATTPAARGTVTGKGETKLIRVPLEQFDKALELLQMLGISAEAGPERVGRPALELSAEEKLKRRRDQLAESKRRSRALSKFNNG